MARKRPQARHSMPPSTARPRAGNYTTTPTMQQQHFPARQRRSMPKARTIRFADSDDDEERGSKRVSTKQETLTQMPDILVRSNTPLRETPLRGETPMRKAAGGSRRPGMSASNTEERRGKQSTLTQMQFVRRWGIPDSDGEDVDDGLEYEVLDSGDLVGYDGNAENNPCRGDCAQGLGQSENGEDGIASPVPKRRKLSVETPVDEKPRWKSEADDFDQAQTSANIGTIDGDLMAQSITTLQSVSTPNKRNPQRGIPSSQSPEESPSTETWKKPLFRETRSPLQPRTANFESDPTSASSLKREDSPIAVNGRRKSARLSGSRHDKVEADPLEKKITPKKQSNRPRVIRKESNPKYASLSKVSNRSSGVSHLDPSATIPDSDSEHDDTMTLPSASPGIQNRSLPPTYSSQSTTTLPHPSKPTFSQASTVGDTQSTLEAISSRKTPLGAMTRTWARSPPSSLQRAMNLDSSSPHVDRERNSDTMHWTESQLLPDSILGFKLPKLPGWSQESE